MVFHALTFARSRGRCLDLNDSSTVDFVIELKMLFDDTVIPLYNGTHYNSKILYNVISISTEKIYCS